MDNDTACRDIRAGRGSTRRQFVRWVAAAAGAAALPAAARAAEGGAKQPERPFGVAKDKPNFIIIFADDLGYGDLGCYGSKHIRTPRIDRMAGEGVRFTDFYVGANVCSPSRAALLTGCYPQRCGVPMGLSPRRAEHKNLGLNPNEHTLGELLQKRGYATMAVGKWHLGWQEMFHPTNQGFDAYFGMPWNYGHSPILVDGRKIVQNPVDLTTITQRYTERAVRFITANRNRPFFLYLAHTVPHLPLRPNPKFKGTSRAGAYGDVVEELDWSVGAVLDALVKLDLDERTLVIFTSDNGPAPQFAQQYGSGGPLRGSKYTTFEAGHREPFIARWPGRVPAGRTCGELITSMDLLPTLVRLAGGREPADRKIDGKDIAPLLLGRPGAKSPHDVLYYYNNTHLQAVRWRQWKLHLPRKPEMCPWWQGTKGIASLDEPLLFDLRADPGAKTNVAARHPDVVRRMLALAEAGRKDLGDTGRKGAGQRPTGRAENARTVTPLPTLGGAKKGRKPGPGRRKRSSRADS